MADISLFEAQEKARWARQHYDSLWPEIDAFQKRDDYRIAVDINTDTGEYVFRVHDLPTPDPDWGLRIGDCLHNARAALDYLMVRLYCLGTEQEPKEIETIQFPVCNSPHAFAASRSVQEFRKEPALSGYLARVEELQPFNEHNPSVWGMPDAINPRTHALLPLALSKLSDWDNTDKHRVIHATLLSGALQFIEPQYPQGFKFLGGDFGHNELKDGAKIGGWQFETPLPSAWEPSEVDMKRQFPIEVSIDEPLLPRSVLQVLPLCLWGINQVLAIFDPVFTNGQPPLPVTVSLGDSP